jgi:protein-disulfide isomerase
MEVMREARLMQAVSDRDHLMGPLHAPITLIHYGDFECPYSREAARVVEVLQEQFEDQLQIVFRHFPLITKHPHAQRAAEAAEAAAAQGRFWKMAELLFAYQRKLTDPYLTRYAMLLGMDIEKFEHDLATHTHMERIGEDMLSGKHNGVIRTPTFFINGQRYQGSDDLPSLKAVVRLTLAAEGSRQ